MYRVIQKSKFFGNISEVVIWEGEDIIELSREYPPSKIYSADPLGHCEFEDGYIMDDYHFEKLEDGAWIKIEDPRVRLNKELTWLEIETERENRKMFPGDYEE